MPAGTPALPDLGVQRLAEGLGGGGSGEASPSGRARVATAAGSSSSYQAIEHALGHLHAVGVSVEDVERDGGDQGVAQRVLLPQGAGDMPKSCNCLRRWMAATPAGMDS